MRNFTVVRRGLLLSLWLLVLGLGGLLCYEQLPRSVALYELFLPTANLDVLLLQNYSLPRIAIALLAGGILGFASSLLQQVMHNPLASDNTLGISSGAQFALFISAIFMPHWLEYGSALLALSGAVISLLLVFFLAWRKNLSPLLLILAGLVVNLYFGAFASLLMLFYPEESRGLALWGAGSLVQESWRDSQGLLLQSLPALLLTVALIRPLSMLSLNDSNAASLGVPVQRLRLMGVALAAYLIACVVSAVGMLGFIGLASATMARQLGGRSFATQLLFAFMLGALLLSLTDLCLQLLALWRGIYLPTGAVTALFGTPLLLWLMFRALPAQSQINQTQTSKPLVVRPRILGWAFLLLLLCLLLSLTLGRNGDGWLWFDNKPLQWLLIELRYPRVLACLAVGILLAVAGVILQRLTLNPMASPELLGVSSGTSMGILVALFIFSAQQTGALYFAGISGAVVALLLLLMINARLGLSPEKVLLTGMALSALFDTLQRLAVASGDPRAGLLLSWSAGSTQSIPSEMAQALLSASLCLFVIALLFSRWLELLGLQAPMAQALGLNLTQVRWLLILFVALLTALATLVIGPLSFIGLLIPHLARLFVARIYQQILLAALLGASLMLFADWLGRQMLFPYDIPAGLVATLIGGGYFLLMMRKI